jgi:hypothetical protein
MTPAPLRRIGTSDDSGAALALALMVVTVIALVVGGLLTITDSSLRTTSSVRFQGTVAATADGAAQAAINTLRLGSYQNDPAGDVPQCFGTSDTLELPNLVPGGPGSPANSAAVQCRPDPNTGVAGVHVPVTPANRPDNAILTLSSDAAEDGLHVKALNKSVPFTVHGSVASNSNITVTNGTLKSDGAVQARTGCSGTIVSTPAPVCNGPAVNDPNYPAAATTVPAYQAVPVNTVASCPAGVVTFQPGYYDDAAALSNLMSGNGACRGSVWWFTPGTYYFDFQNAAGAIPGLSGSDRWLIKDGQLVAGTPIDPAGRTLSAPKRPAAVPGACLSPTTSTSAIGVQFIFGGDSQLQLAGSADAEICGTYRANRPPIVLYGLTSGVAVPTTSTGGTAATVTTDAGGFAAPAGQTLSSALTAADGRSDVWTGGGDCSATLDLSGFANASAVPAGSILTSAKLRIVHGASSAATSRSVTVTPAGGAAPRVVTVSTTARSAGSTTTVDLTSAVATAAHSSGLAGLGLRYSSSMGAGGTEQIDAVFLDLTYTAPAFRGETTAAVPGNCLASAYTGGSAGQCAVFSTATSYKGKLYVQGTMYAPIAPIDLTLNNVTTQAIRFGVISRTLWAKETGSIRYTGPVVEVPDMSPGAAIGGTVVYLTAYVCPGSATCSASTGRLALRTRVYIYDPTGAPVPASRQMTIQSWAVQR